MSDRQFSLGYERKIGYSFLGLLAGNLASLVALLLIAVPLRLHLVWFSGFRRVWNLSVGEALGWFYGVWIYSMPAWVVIGLPVVLLLRAKIVARLYWIVAVLIGALIGIFALLLLICSFDGGHLHLAALSGRGTLLAFCLAALIAGVAFAVYCKLVKRAVAVQRKSGARSGAPQFFSALD